MIIQFEMREIVVSINNQKYMMPKMNIHLNESEYDNLIENIKEKDYGVFKEKGEYSDIINGNLSNIWIDLESASIISNNLSKENEKKLNNFIEEKNDISVKKIE